MYKETVTIFNRLPGGPGQPDTWLATVLHNCNLQVNNAAMIAKYGSKCEDTAVLNVPASPDFLPPRKWLESDHSGFTFQNGQIQDFFFVGAWESRTEKDTDYPDGFYQYMNKAHDGVYAVTGYSEYTVIPHYEVMGR